MNLKKLQEILKNDPEKCNIMHKAKVEWPTYKQVKRHSKMVHKVLFKLFKGHVVECNDFIDCGDIKGQPVLIAK